MKKSSENKIYTAIGLMSGTAMDGIDAAMIETDGYGYIKPIGFISIHHDADLRTALKACLNRTDRQAIDIVKAEKDFTLAQVPAILSLINKFSKDMQYIDIVGFHGQTTHHDPSIGLTIQLGDGALLAQELGRDVVYDFRSADMGAGGQGAPFLPVYHRALVVKDKIALPVAVVNIGGVGNVTWIGQDSDDLIAFDTGPGNAMIDDWVQRHGAGDYDEGGKIAAQGQVDEGRVQAFLSLPYFEETYPKSLDRNDFSAVDMGGLSLADGAATLTEMTVASIARGVEQCPQAPHAIYVTGGGRHNDFMMRRLGALTGLPVHSVDDLGWDGDAMEAQGFAYMAVRHLLGEPISFPGTTGCAHPTVGGVLVRPSGMAKAS